MDPLMYEELDLEELEWKLYSQVYHSTQEYEESPAVLDSINSDIPSNPENQKKYFRYFDNRNSQSTPPTKGQTYISLDRNRTESLNKDTRTPTIQNDITINSNSTTVHTNCVDPQRFHNNITVNQYTVPVIIHPDGVLPRPEKYFRSWSAETLKLLPPNKRPRKPKNKKKQRAGQSSKKLNPYQNGTLLKPITIWLSDDSDDECVIVDSNTSNTKLTKLKTGFPKKYDESEGGNKPESDDDIIYIPPPPIEVIDIEENGILPDAEPCSSSEFDSNTSKVIEEHTFDSTEKSRTPPHDPAVLETPESVASNDFLESQPAATSSSNFNFSLHGSDFNNHPGDFVRPPSKTVETCETESSCSTNDQSRDFSNTVKTIVFDEIEFPREDIFSEKNLESFSSFITPKRNSKQARESSTGKGVSIFAENTRDDTSSDSSSSESDYEPPREIESGKISENDRRNKSLPNLSPMVPNEIARKVSSNKKTASNFFSSSLKDVSKRKDNIEKCPESMKETVDSPKKKKKKTLNPEKNVGNKNQADSKKNNVSTNITAESDECESDKQKKKKRKSNSTESVQSASEPENATTALEKPKKKKKKRDVPLADEPQEIEQGSPENLASEDANVGNMGSVMNKTAENQDTNPSQEYQPTSSSEGLDSQKILTEKCSLEKSKKKKKGCSTSSVDPDTTNDSPEKLKKKKKKRNSTTEKQVEVENEMDGTQPKKTSEETALTEVSTVAESPENLPHDEEDQLASKGDESPTVMVLDDTMEKSCEGDVEVVESSDSELDYKVLDDVGGDLKLANCSGSVGGSKQNEAIVVDESTNSNDKVEIKAREVFSMVRIHKEQSDDPGKWQISYRDRAMYLNMDVNKGPRCNRCRHFGHTAVRCLEKPEPPKCFLCGRPDHQEPRCPNRRCTQCGNKGDFSTTYCWKCFKFRHSVCRLCKMKGHVENTCPDLWRRYHLTTDDGPIVVSREQIKPRDEQWCSGCARQGHLEHECKSYPREYPPTTPYIVNYEDNLCLSESRLARYLVSSTITSEGQTSNEVVGQGSESLAGPLVLPNETQIPNVFVNPPLPALLPLPMISQVSAVNQFLTPNHLQYLSQLPVLTQLQSLAAIQNQMMVPNPASANYAAETANRVLNPCSVPASSGISSPIHFDNRFYLKNADKIDVMDPNRVKHLILTMPFAVVNDFLVKEMEELERCDVQPRLLKSKLFKCDKPGQPRKPMPASWQREKLFWFRLINMFIFGKHRLGDGRLHVNYLKKYLANPKPDQLNEHKRRSLLSSYSYIFTYDKHRNVNYYKWINNLIQKYDRGEAEKYIM